MLTIDITPYTSGVHRVELDPAPEAVDLEPDTFKNLHVEATLQAHRDRILVHLRATATAELTCDRTLTTYDQPLEGTYSVLFGPESMVGTESDRYDEVRPLSPTDNEVDVTDVVRDTIQLAIPQRTIAPGAENEALQTTYGAPSGEDDDEKAVDPRWSKLQELRDDEEASDE
jgi:uncharacterized protein